MKKKNHHQTIVKSSSCAACLNTRPAQLQLEDFAERLSRSDLRPPRPISVPHWKFPAERKIKLSSHNLPPIFWKDGEAVALGLAIKGHDKDATQEDSGQRPKEERLVVY